jgi:hypothetical protein
MPGGHMTYFGLLIKILLKHLPADKKFITATGSAHGAQTYFPPHIPHGFNINSWDKHIAINIKQYSYENICVFKDSWAVITPGQWAHNINSLEAAFCLVSSPITKLDWYYSWINIVNKLPLGVYGFLKTNSPLFPIWHMLPNKHKINALVKAMPVFPLKENMTIKVPNLRLATTDVLKAEFPFEIHEFLIRNGFNSCLTEDILIFHEYFTSKQLANYELAKLLNNNIRWEAKGLFDKILFTWLDTNPWEE